MAHALPRRRREPAAAKVPEITFLFWIIKLLTTASGEAISDYLALHGHLLAGMVEVTIFCAALVVQFGTRRYTATAYWFLALAIAIFGTGVADALHLIVGIPYGGTTVMWLVILAAIFWVWYRSEGTLSIHSIVTTRRELFYWATVFATFALGTALGDFTAYVAHLGYLGSAVLFVVIICVPLVAWRFLRMDAVFSFWFAYVITRPLGASFADWFSKPPDITGLGYGDAAVSAVTLLVITALVAYITIARHGIQLASKKVQPVSQRSASYY
jgi:uncharacterized membrane-anchored protein